jgi:hypothetical protein
MTDFSNQATDKLQAAVNHDRDDPDRAFASVYIEACATWFDGLSNDEKLVAALAASAFEDGDTAAAAKIAEPLPPAPKFPLSEDV